MAKSKSEWRSISWWAFLGFGVSLAVHISTFFDIYISGIWILHIGLFFVWIPVFLVSQSRGLTSSNFFGRSSWIPGWGQGLLILACLYGLINFANAPSKQPYEFNGKYMIQRDGTNYEISKQEYNHIQALILRGFSGHWMMFYLASALYLFYLPPTVSVTDRDDQDDDWGEQGNNNDSWD